MNQRPLVLAMLVVGTLVGCSKKVTEIVEVRVPVESSTEQDQVITTLAPLEQLKSEVAKARASGNITEQELKIVSRLLKQVFNTLAASDQSIAEIANLVAMLPGDGADNMLMLMGAADDIESASSLENKMDQLYSRLDRENEPVSIAVDQFILKYFTIKNLSIETSTQSQLAATSSMISYYLNKFYYLLEEKKMSGAEVFENYAILENFVRGRALDYIFKDLILEVNLKKSASTQSFKTFGKLLKNALERNLFEPLFLPTENVFKSAITYGQWSVKNLVTETEYSNYLAAIDDVNRLFDRSEKEFVNIRDERWFDLSDQRLTLVMQEMQKQLKKNVRAVNVQDIHLVMPRHPLTQIYVTRAYLEAANASTIRDVVTLVGQESFESFKDNFVRKIRDNNGVVSFLDSKFKNVESAKSEITNLKRQYLANTYDVIISRFFIEFQNLTTGNIAIEAGSEATQLYKNAFVSMLNIVNIRNNTDGDEWVTYDDIKVKQRDTDLDIDHHEGTYVFDASQACGENSLLTKTGIFVAQGDLTIPCAGKSIVFGPLSMLYAPGKDININVESIVNPWIDASGLDGNLYALDENENLAEAPTQGSHAISRGNEYFINPGRHPQKQTNGENGNDAGQIIYAVNHIEGIPLSVSLGGNGAKGADGFSVPMEMRASSIIDGIEVFSYQPLTFSEGAQGVNTGVVGRRCRRPIGQGNAGMEECTDIYGDIPYNHVQSRAINLNRGIGGDGGNGGRGNMLRFNVPINTGDKYSLMFKNSLVAPGIGGQGGKAGEFGAGAAQEFEGQNGAVGAGIIGQ